MSLNARLVLLLGWFKPVGDGEGKGEIKPRNQEPASSENHLCSMRVIMIGVGKIARAQNE